MRLALACLLLVGCSASNPVIPQSRITAASPPVKTLTRSYSLAWDASPDATNVIPIIYQVRYKTNVLQVDWLFLTNTAELGIPMDSSTPQRFFSVQSLWPWQVQ